MAHSTTPWKKNKPCSDLLVNIIMAWIVARPHVFSSHMDHFTLRWGQRDICKLLLCKGAVKEMAWGRTRTSTSSSFTSPPASLQSLQWFFFCKMAVIGQLSEQKSECPLNPLPHPAEGNAGCITCLISLQNSRAQWILSPRNFQLSAFNRLPGCSVRAAGPLLQALKQEHGLNLFLMTFANPYWKNSDLE